jgi:hypothetical protein
MNTFVRVLKLRMQNIDNGKLIINSKINLIDENPIRVSVLNTLKEMEIEKRIKSKT